MAAVTVALSKQPAVPAQPFQGFGAQLNTNVFRPASMFPDPLDAAKDHPEDREQEGQPKALTKAQVAKLGSAITNLQPGHSRVFVGRALVATPDPPPRELD